MQQNRLDHIDKASIFIDVSVTRVSKQHFLPQGPKRVTHLRKLKDVLIDPCEEKLQGLERRWVGVQILLDLWLHIVDIPLFQKREPQRAFGREILK